MTIDLTDARDVVDSVFEDDGTECVITSDPQGSTDDMLDESTLALTPRTGDTTTVYTGPCLARPVQGFGQSQRQEGGTQQYLDTWRLRLPTTATGVDLGHLVTFTSAPNDAELLGRSFRITKRLGGSLSVSRLFLMEERERGPRI